jgi:hypothetical protein
MNIENSAVNLINTEDFVTFLNSNSIDLQIIPGMNDDVLNGLTNRFNIITNIQLYGQFLLLFENSLIFTLQTFYLWLENNFPNIENRSKILIAFCVKEKLHMMLGIN